MKFTLSNGSIGRIEFTHERGTHERGTHVADHVTRCRVKVWPPGSSPRDGDFYIVAADAYCSTSDNFCRETGRAIALRRVLPRLPKWDRKAVADAYWGRPRGSK